MIDDAHARRFLEVDRTDPQERRRHLGSDHDHVLQGDETTDINHIDDHRPRGTRIFPLPCPFCQLPVENLLSLGIALPTNLATNHLATSMDQKEMNWLASSRHREVLPRSVLCPTVQDQLEANLILHPQDQVASPTQRALQTHRPAHAAMCRLDVVVFSHVSVVEAGRRHHRVQVLRRGLPHRLARRGSRPARVPSP